jgi:hypothetical protein
MSRHVEGSQSNAIPNLQCGRGKVTAHSDMHPMGAQECTSNAQLGVLDRVAVVRKPNDHRPPLVELVLSGPGEQSQP